MKQPKFLTLCLVITSSFLFLNPVLALPLLHKNNQDCDPTGSEWTAYSGIRISHEVLLRANHQMSSSELFRLHEQYFSNTKTLAKIELTSSSDLYFNVDHNMILTKCDYGDITSQIFVPLGANIDAPWNQTICTPTNNCYRIARRRMFLKRKMGLHFPGSIIGGIFQQSDVADNSWNPISPLVSERPFQSWTQLKFGSAFKDWHLTNISEIALSHRIPLLYTPDILDRRYPRSLHWTKFVDPYERYSGVADPRRVRNILSDWASKSLGRKIEQKASSYIAEQSGNS